VNLAHLREVMRRKMARRSDKNAGYQRVEYVRATCETAKRFSTHVALPPFLKRLPLPEAMTTGLTDPLVTAGA
jgi:hypothetical protein